jgi:hypothetical protein
VCVCVCVCVYIYPPHRFLDKLNKVGWTVELDEERMMRYLLVLLKKCTTFLLFKFVYFCLVVSR